MLKRIVIFACLLFVACSREEPLLFDKFYEDPCEAFHDISRYALEIHVSRDPSQYRSLRLESSKKLAADIDFKGTTNTANCKDIESYAKAQPSKTKMEVYSDALFYFMQEMDPHSLYIRQSRAEDFRKKDKNITNGIGFEPKYIHRAIKYAMNIDTIILDYVYPDTPAFGFLKAEDEIEEINGEIIEGKSFDEVNKLINEKKNNISIKVKRLDEPKSFTLMQFQKPALYSKPITKDGQRFDFVRIPRFVDGISNELRKKITELNAEGTEGIILDLRGNPGGFVNEGAAVLQLFIQKGGEIFHTEGSGKVSNLASEYRYQSYGVDGRALFTKPLIVLVDSDTASIAEAVAGSLKHQGRAIVIGNNTFGKGSVQVDQMISSKNGFGGLLITTISLLYYPNDDTHQIAGLAPTYELDDEKFLASVEQIKQKDQMSIFYEKDYPNTIKPHGMKVDGLMSDNGGNLNVGNVTNTLSKTCDDVAYQECLETYAVKFLEILKNKKTI